MTRERYRGDNRGKLKLLQMEYYYKTPRCPTSQIQKKTSSTSFAAHSVAMSPHPLLCRTQSLLIKLHLRPLRVTCTTLYYCITVSPVARP